MSYTVIITEEVAANIAVTTQNYPITIEYNATSILAPAGSYGNANVAANLAAFGSNPITTTGNITAGYFVGDGSLLTGIAASYGNANVAANLAAFGSNPITTTGNITAGYFSGDGSLLTALTGANVVGVVAQAAQANTANSATSAGSATTAGTANIALVANSVAGANVSGVVAQATQAATANIALVANSVDAANVVGVVAQAAQANTANTATTAGSATTAGTANVALVANSVAGANVSGVVAQAAQANTANTAVTVTGNAQANITSVGILSSLSVSGNVTGGTFLGNGAVPTGGDSESYLVKNSDTNYDYSWTDRVNAKTIFETVKNVSGGSLTKGTPVYQVGVSGLTITVAAARADDPAKLAVGVLDVTLADEAEGRMIVLGEIIGVNTAAFTTGDEIYLGATGGYTNVKPTSSSVAIQFLGVVNRVDASNGSGFITGTLVPDSVKYDSYAQVWTGNAWVTATELASDTSPALGGNLAGGAFDITTTGNITAGNILINTDAVITGNLTVNGTTTTINSNVVTVNDKTFVLANNQSTSSGVDGSGIIAGNPGVASILYSNANTAWETNIGVNVSGAVSATGNITGNYFIGNGSQLTGLPASYSDANVTTLLASGNVSTDIVTTGDITGGSLESTSFIAATGNIVSSANVIGNGQYLTNLTAANITGVVAEAALANTANSATTAGTVTDAAQGNITSVGTLTSLSVSGNITGANLVATANLTSTQQTIIGTANVGTTGNIVISGKNIATDMQWLPDGGNAVTAGRGRVLVGTGHNGSDTFTAIQSRFMAADTVDRANNGTAIRSIDAQLQTNLTANVTNGGFRHQVIGGTVRVGGGAAGNTVSLPIGVGTVFGISAGQFNVEIGNTPAFGLGNTVVSQATVNGGALQVAEGSTIQNGYGISCLVISPPGTNNGNVNNYIGYSSSVFNPVSGNLYMFYNGNSSSGGSTGVLMNNNARAAAKYYFLMNEDDLAQVQLGSLRRYHEFETPATTSGSFALDKNTAQVHSIVPTGNCTITGYSNMVVSASDGTNTDAQVDTLTVIVKQGATPYTVTLPTGSAYKYAGGVSTVGATANAVTMISVTAANVAGTTTYLTTVSPEFV